MTADFAEMRLGIFVFLCVVISGNPPGGMVARHRHLRFLVYYGKLLCGLFREDVPESESIIKNAELDIHSDIATTHIYSHLPAVIRYGVVFAPDGCPRFVYCGMGDAVYVKSLSQAFSTFHFKAHQR